MIALLMSLLVMLGALQQNSLRAPQRLPAEGPLVTDGATPIIENERVTVWDLSWTKGIPAAMDRRTRNAIWVYLSPVPGQVVFWAAGAERTPPSLPGRAIVIELKAGRVAPLLNTSGYPNAFPREGSVKKIDNDQIVTWHHTWTPGKPSPVHFHDKDVVVVYLKSGTLKSTTPDGQVSSNQLTPGLTRFNPRDRVHTETLVEGESQAIITELK